MLDVWFASRTAPIPADSWEHVYRLLLWIDRTTGLAHCYESDKSQPGRRWYGRSLAFHGWIAAALGTTPAGLADRIDWLFQRAIEDLASALGTQQSRAEVAAQAQLSPYAGLGFPEPGDDPELVSLIRDELTDYLQEQPPARVWRTLTDRIHTYLTQENKRKNLVGEGFEDVLAAVISRLGASDPLSAETRRFLHDLPGFYPPRGNEKPKRVDLAILNPITGHRTLVTAKWSIRADREEQFVTDYSVYERLEQAGREFDPARLIAACDNLRGNRLLFSHVVHVNTDGLIAAYGPSPQRSAAAVLDRIGSRRLYSLSDWLTELVAPSH
ncbi:MAG: hypothetical protein LC667_13375 [Thioalkalivibrio sp.]|nr:hypothetical protein [Thioalkalivibrio sp.]